MSKWENIPGGILGLAHEHLKQMGLINERGNNRNETREGGGEENKKIIIPAGSAKSWRMFMVGSKGGTLNLS